MNILIINQPINNRGDEAAHRSLMRSLNNLHPKSRVTVFFSNANQESVNEFEVKHSNNNYINTKSSFTFGSSFMIRWSLRLGLVRLSLLHPHNRKILKYIKNTDLVICAPGGICMGLFQSWSHVYNLKIAKSFDKKIVYYSRSIGPFPEKTIWNKVFKKISIELLNYFKFISLRDSKSMRLADNMGIKYLPSIDTALLDTPKYFIPTEISEIINGKKYIIFVPNSLTWHPAFKNCPESFLEEFYCEIMKLLLSIDSDIKILMLPQLCNISGGGDVKYFKHLRDKIDSNRVEVISDIYSSDIQQSIISKSNLMIGSRYHSVVFAINNNVPFVALSYEHKVSGLLEILDLQKNNYSIEKFGEKLPDLDNAMHDIKAIIGNVSQNKVAKEKANKIAKDCMICMLDQCAS